MAQELQNYDVWLKDTHSLSFTATSGGSALDISTAAEIKWVITANSDSTTALLTKLMTTSGITIVNGANGTFRVDIASGDLDDIGTGTFYHSTFIEMADGSKFTVATGYVQIKPAAAYT